VLIGLAYFLNQKNQKEIMILKNKEKEEGGNEGIKVLSLIFGNGVDCGSSFNLFCHPDSQLQRRRWSGYALR
jgi:hypothetical protein